MLVAHKEKNLDCNSTKRYFTQKKIIVAKISNMKNMVHRCIVTLILSSCVLVLCIGTNTVNVNAQQQQIKLQQKQQLHLHHSSLKIDIMNQKK
jgi:hypothetical protein